jgi:hypothetical protein
MEGKAVKNRRRKTGLYIAAAAAAIVLLTANWLAHAAEKGLLLRADMTRGQHTVLTSSTKSMLEGLKKDIYIYYISSRGQDVLTDGLLQSYDAESERVHYSAIGEESLPKAWENAGAAMRSVVVSDAPAPHVGAGRYHVISHEDLYADIGFKGERALSPAIKYVAEGALKRAVFLAGEGEAQPCGSLLGDIALYYEADFKAADSELDAGSDILLVLSPRQDITEESRSNIKAFLDSGGSAAFFIGGEAGETSELENFRSLLAEYGISIEYGIIIGGNPSKTYLSPANVMPGLSKEGEMLGLSSMSPILSCARPITVTQLEGVTVTPLLWTDESCFLKQPEAFGFERSQGDSEGAFLAGALARKGDSAIAVITSSSFAASEESYSYKGNSELFIGVLGVLSGAQGDYGRGAARILSRQSSGLGVEPLLLIAAAGLLPAVIMAAGFARWRARNRQ